MEPKNHPIEKENLLPNLHFWVPCKFSGVYVSKKPLQKSKQLTQAGIQVGVIYDELGLPERIAGFA